MALHVDGSSNFKGSALWLVLTSLNGDNIEQLIRCGFRATNNKAECEALIARLGLAQDMGIKRIKILSNSQLVANQMNSTYQAKDMKMTTYLKKRYGIKGTFQRCKYRTNPKR